MAGHAVFVPPSFRRPTDLRAGDDGKGTRANHRHPERSEGPPAFRGVPRPAGLGM